MNKTFEQEQAEGTEGDNSVISVSSCKMRERPMLFSWAMVRAIVAGRKSQTRRVVKPQPGVCGIDECVDNWIWRSHHTNLEDLTRLMVKECPYGQPGDRIWVRESFYRFGHWEPVSGVKTKTGRQKWMFVPANSEIRFEDNPPSEFRKGRHHKDPQTKAWHKRPARFMPRKASRIALEITGVRVERLQDISEEDAIAEGCIMDGVFPKLQPDASGIGEMGWDSAREWYSWLWEEINGPGSWDMNPWVWVMQFKRVRNGILTADKTG